MKFKKFLSKHKQVVLVILILTASFLLGAMCSGIYIRGYEAGRMHPHYYLVDRGDTFSFHFID